MLATCCPYCQTRFRVTAAQLELREGLVRCGACREIFNGREYLLGEPEEIDTLATAGQEADGRMTLIDFGSLRANQPAVTSKMQEELDELSKAIADLQAKPWRDTPPHELAGDAPVESVSAATAATPPNPPPTFVAQARKQGQRSKHWTFLLWLGLPLLLLALAAQLSYFFRADLAAYSPDAGHYLRAACARLGCQVKLPQHIDLLSLESSHLQEVPGQLGQYTLTALLRNQADTAQAWPSLDLQLKTETGQPLVRKVMEPATYLNTAELKKGIAAHAEHEIQFSFELTAEHPGGFSVTLFYH
ncbi:MAG: zinc-ribbon and DUF3426 domain-containing protein [Oxalobacteraceae bacterium]